MKTVTLYNFKPIYLIVILDILLTIWVYSMCSKRTEYTDLFETKTVVDFKVIKFDSIHSKGVILKNLKTGRELRRTDPAVLSIAEGRDVVSLQVDVDDALTFTERRALWPEQEPLRGVWFFYIIYGVVVSVAIACIDEEFATFRGFLMVLIGIGLIFV